MKVKIPKIRFITYDLIRGVYIIGLVISMIIVLSKDYSTDGVNLVPLLRWAIIHMSILILMSTFSTSSQAMSASLVGLTGYVYTLIGVATAMRMLGADNLNIKNFIAPFGTALFTSIIGWSYSGLAKHSPGGGDGGGGMLTVADLDELAKALYKLQKEIAQSLADAKKLITDNLELLKEFVQGFTFALKTFGDSITKHNELLAEERKKQEDILIEWEKIKENIIQIAVALKSARNLGEVIGQLEQVSEGLIRLLERINKET